MTDRPVLPPRIEPMDDEPRNPRGCLIFCLISAVVWVVVGLAIWRFS